MKEQARSLGGRKKSAFMVRMPDGMREHLKAEAEKNGRSLNSEIVHRLIESIGGMESMETDSEPEYVQMKLPVSKELHDALAATAAKQNRSMNAQIVHFLTLAIEEMAP